MKSSRIPLLGCLMFFTGLLSLHAQSPFFRQIPLQRAGINFKINAICQDATGFIWLATNEGLYRNNGSNFTRVDLPAELQSGNITALSSHPENGIVAGTGSGKLFSVMNDSIVVFDLSSVKTAAPVSDIEFDNNNDLWFSTTGNGVFRLANDKIEHYTTGDGLGDNYVYCLLVADHMIWTGSDGGLSFGSLKPGSIKFINLTTRDGLPDNIIRHIEKGPVSTIGIGMEEGGFCIYDVESKAFRHIENFTDWSFGTVTSLVKLENEFWIGTKQSGIFDFEFSGEFRRRQFSGDAGFNGSNVDAMIMDHEGNIWIGAGNELYLSPGEKIEFRNQMGNVELKNIHALLIDSKNNFWISNDSGVFHYAGYKYNGEGLVSEYKSVHTKKPNVISLYEDHYGYIWMGTFDEGVIRYDPRSRQEKIFTEKDGLVNANVLSIDGNKDEIWFATLGGVSRCSLKDSTLTGEVLFESFTEQDGLGNNFIYKVFIDSRQRVWFGTDGKGITCFENGHFSNYSEQQGLKSKIIYSITEDTDGMIWLSSSDEGIYRFDGKSFRNLNIEKGLSDLNITSVISDEKGNIVVVSKKGIDIVNPATLEVLSFGSEMGILKIDPDLNVTDIDNKGNVWIGASNGIILLNLKPDASKSRLKIQLNHVLCFLERVDTATTHTYPYDRNHISFDYTAFWYLDPARVSYQYKLDGYNREWITTRDRFVTFPNLGPGDYTFMVRSSINNNFNNSEIIRYQFRIKTPFWEQTWFMLVIGAVILLLIYLYIKVRVERLRAKERLKKEKIESQYEILKNQVNPHFLFNSFNTLITVIEDDRDVAIEYVNKLSDFFRCILTYREKDLITIREELELVETYIFLQQKRYGNNFNVIVNVPAESRDQFLIPPLSLQILIENCLKHNSVSRETKLHVEVSVEGNQYLVVKNNINPKFKKEPSTGIGLQNLKNRYQLISNSAIIVEKTDQYFIVKIPLILH